MNFHQLHFLDIQQNSNCTIGFDDVRQLFLDKSVTESHEKWTDDDELKLCRLTSLYQVAVKLIVVDFDVEKTEESFDSINNCRF